MREDQWLASDEPRRMLTALRKKGKASRRKLALFVVAGDRLLLTLLSPVYFYDLSERWLEIYEREAETGEMPRTETFPDPTQELPANLSLHEFEWVRRLAFDSVEERVRRARTLAPSDRFDADEYRAMQVSYLRCIFGNPYRTITLDHSFVTPRVKQLAAAIYEEKAFERLPILADALEEAGCTNVDILDHCRQQSVHVRGCWLVDLLLEKQ